MPATVSLSRKAWDLRKEGRHAEALAIYADLWKNNRPSCNEWDAWGYAYCLRKLGRSQEALQICRKGLKINQEMPQLKSLYAWCIYDTEIKLEEVQDEGRFLRSAQEICELTTNESQFSPRPATVFRVLRHFDELFNPRKVLEWTDVLDPDCLSRECHRGVDESGKTREYASNLEVFYVYRTKALEKLGRYEECRRVCEEAQERIKKFHFDNDVWLTRRLAIALGHLNEPEKALKMLRGILSKKRDWFILHEVAEAMVVLGKDKEAFPLALAAALAVGEPYFKGELYLLLAHLLESRGCEIEARKHVELAIVARREHNWNMTDRIRSAAATYGVDDNALESSGEILQELNEYWKNELEKLNSSGQDHKGRSARR